MVTYDIDDNNGHQWIADSSIDGSLNRTMQEGGILSERQQHDPASNYQSQICLYEIEGLRSQNRYTAQCAVRTAVR